MKKLLSLFVAVALLVGCMAFTACDTAVKKDVYVTVSLAGTLVLAGEKITARDRNGDGKVDVDEALYAAHAAKYEGDPDRGYGSLKTEYGLSLAALWGDVSGAFGYYKNDVSLMELGAEVEDGDRITAFVYKDTATWSDQYSYFDRAAVAAKVGDGVTLTLSASGYDANWAPVTLPVEGATVTVDGEETAFVTDGEGKVTLTFDRAGTYLVSAKSDTATLVPPVCIVTVENA